MKPNVALMLYGVLNSHNEINQPGSNHFSLPKALLALAERGNIKLKVFVYTEDKCFFKWTPPEYLGTDSIRGYRIVTWIEDRYCVCQYDKSQITADLSKVYGTSLADVVIIEDGFDPEAWSSSKDPYQSDGTSNRWRNTMITTFLAKKKAVLQLAKRHAENENHQFDAYIIARPDSKIPPRYKADDAISAILSATQAVTESQVPLLFYDQANINKQTFDEKVSPGMMANDFVVGNLAGVEAKVSLIDLIQTDHAGNFFNSYTEPTYRCNRCFHLDHFTKKPVVCPVCANPTLTLVTEWPEYKMFAHLRSQGIDLRPMPFKGQNLR